MTAAGLLIWDFDGTLAQRRGETGWSTLLAEALDAEEPGHAHSAETFRPHLRAGFPWHHPERAHPELGEPGAWWTAVRPLLARAYEAAGYPPGRSVELAAAAQRLYVDPSVGWAGYEKPHRRAFEILLDELRPCEAWMVGDNVVADVLGAEALGIPAVLVRRPDPRAPRYADSLAGVERFLGEEAAAA